MSLYSEAGARVSRRRWGTWGNYLQLLVLALVVALVVVAVLLRHQFTAIGVVGYPSVALLSLLASASMFVPVPGIASVCTGGWLLSPLVVALVGGTGSCLGELTAYGAGFGGRGFVERQRLYHRMEGWMRRHGWMVLFILSVIPNPIFDVAGVAAGALRFPLWKFLGVLWVGKFLKSLGIAYACALGVDIVLRFFQSG